MWRQYFASLTLTDKQVKSLGDVLDIQGQRGNWDADQYMLGMYNGMELMDSIVDDRDPKFRELKKKKASLKLSSNDQYPDTFVDVTIDDDGYIYHKDANGELHNPYGPAVIWPNGRKEYFIHGKCHRTDGPAVIHPSGSKFYWVNDNLLSEEEFNKLYRV